MQGDRAYRILEGAPLASALGAEVSGVDLARLDDAAFAEVHRAFLQHQVLFFREQHLAPTDFAGFARRFGEIGAYPFARGMDGRPEIVEIVKEPHQTSNFGGMWHSDTAYLEFPPKATLLTAIETPAAGGDTLFASMTAAYRALSEGLRAILDGLTGVNTSALHAASSRGDHLASGSMASAEESPEALTAEHPAVRRHPETWRPALYVNPAHTGHFLGLTAEESAPILGYLFRHAVQPEFTCRFRWTPGALAIWDNRCTWHCAINDYDGQRRIMRRVTIRGEKPEAKTGDPA